MQDTIKTYLEQAKIGRKQTYRNMTVFPVLSAYCLDLEYLLLDEALSEDAVEVVEVDQDGAVPELKVINRSPQMILILDGEELVGAKQNRIVNTTILIQGNSTTVIPVSCVEEGRWSYDSPRFSSNKRMMSSGLRAAKSEQVCYSIRETGKFRADQAVIWDEIADKAGRRGAESPSMAMAEIYEKDRPSIQKYLKHFKLIDSQVGAIFMINGKVAGMDSLGKPGTFSKVFNKLVESYALDAVDWYDSGKEHKNLKSDVTKFMKTAHSARTEDCPSVGRGTDYRIESKKMTGFALALDDQVLHLCMFARENSQDSHESGSKMGRFSTRRGNRV